jgi:PleD family two-component response regulator
MGMAKILLIDDDQSIAELFSYALKKSGIDTILALDGKSGLDKAQIEKVDLILLDEVLPDIPGNEILKTLKLDNITKHIPVIILSNFSQEELVKEAINAGALDYIFKYQIEPQDLVARVKKTIEELNRSST